MSDAHKILPQPFEAVGVSVVLGLKGDKASLGAQARALHVAAINRYSFQSTIAHMIAAVLVVFVYRDLLPIALLLFWSLTLVGVHAHGFYQARCMADDHKAGSNRVDVKRELFRPIFAGLLWAMAIIGFSPLGTEIAHFSLWALLLAVVTGSAFFFAFTPLGSMVFATIVGIASSLSFVLLDQFLLSSINALFMFVNVLGAVNLARTNLGARLAETGAAEKDEVVSMLLREFEENEADWLWQIDTTRRVRGVSPRFAFALGREQNNVEGLPLLELISGESWETGRFPTSLHDLAELLKHRESFSNQIVNVSIAGHERWWELSGSPMLDENGVFTGFRGVGSDVTEQRETSEKISYLARFDTLTSLPNRLQVNEALVESLRYAEQWRTRCAFLMVDLDRFKQVNDSLGHLVGDKLLAQVSSRLQSLVEDGQLCGRLGGDEFAIVIRDASDRETVMRVANEVIDQLSKPYKVDQHTLYVGASVGSAVGPRDGTTVEELMRNADLALYKSKDSGGGEHFQFEPSLHASADERRQLESALREALARDEMVLNFQPVVGTLDQEIVSFEALLRWNSKEHGTVRPDKFIPLAEETRMIVPIGTWVLRNACQEAMNWPSHVKVNVNVSPEQLFEPDFADHVVSILAETGLQPDRLELEVTESIFLRDASIARAALEQVMALGCSVALDDFGTGYSSLGYIRKLRFSTIKVDRTFVQGAAQDSAESLAIIRAVVAMAQSLGMTTTAEGVETAEEATLIRDLGCDKIQGYYFGRPMSAADANRIFTRIAAKLRRA